MATIKLGKPPKSIKHTVTFTMLDGSKGQIECEFRYRTRREFGELLKASMSDQAEPTDIADLMARGVEANARYLGEILLGWDLDEEFKLSALEQLCDEVPAAALAIIGAYRDAMVEGRLGN